jgi:DNA-binding transcriptional regulator PaaX
MQEDEDRSHQREGENGTQATHIVQGSLGRIAPAPGFDNYCSNCYSNLLILSAMKKPSAADDLLAVLLWSLDTLARPTPHAILASFEAWDYRTRLRPQLLQLERARFLERRDFKGEATLRLTEQGRAAAWGGVDPVSRWQRAWDGRWRLMLFDLPARDQKLRLRLWRWLRTHRFGYLQLSVWLTPDAIDEAYFPLQDLTLTPASFTVIEGRPVPSDSDTDLVTSAWDFVTINKRYDRVMAIAASGQELAEKGEASPAKLRQWLAAERAAWLTAISNDPLLPERLCPPDYLGQRALEQRQTTFRAMATRGGR